MIHISLLFSTIDNLHYEPTELRKLENDISLYLEHITQDLNLTDLEAIISPDDYDDATIEHAKKINEHIYHHMHEQARVMKYPQRGQNGKIIFIRKEYIGSLDNKYQEKQKEINKSYDIENNMNYAIRLLYHEILHVHESSEAHRLDWYSLIFSSEENAITYSIMCKEYYAHRRETLICLSYDSGYYFNRLKEFEESIIKAKSINFKDYTECIEMAARICGQTFIVDGEEKRMDTLVALSEYHNTIIASKYLKRIDYALSKLFEMFPNWESILVFSDLNNICSSYKADIFNVIKGD